MLAERDLGFKITSHNVEKLIADAGLQIKLKVNRFDKFNNERKNLRTRIYLLEQRLAHLFKRLGEELPMFDLEPQPENANGSPHSPASPKP